MFSRKYLEIGGRNKLAVSDIM